MTEKKFCKFEDKSIKIIQSEEKGEKWFFIFTLKVMFKNILIPIKQKNNF